MSSEGSKNKQQQGSDFWFSAPSAKWVSMETGFYRMSLRLVLVKMAPTNDITNNFRNFLLVCLLLPCWCFIANDLCAVYCPTMSYFPAWNKQAGITSSARKKKDDRFNLELLFFWHCSFLASAMREDIDPIWNCFVPGNEADKVGDVLCGFPVSYLFYTVAIALIPFVC